MRSVVIGMGEVGKALLSVLADKDAECHAFDPANGDDDQRLALIATRGVDVAHVCFPWGSEFVGNVYEYHRRLDGPLTIIHSTVPVGTTRAVHDLIAPDPHQNGVVHSPIHGQHPHLARGIKTFLKYVGGVSESDVTHALGYFLRHGLRAYPVSSPEASELSKLLCTAQYGWQIILCKEIAAICKMHGVPFDEAYTAWNREYNRSYPELHPRATHADGGQAAIDVHRSVLYPTPGPIGGHCVVPNAKLLDSWLTQMIRDRNATYEWAAQADARNANARPSLGQQLRNADAERDL